MLSIPPKTVQKRKMYTKHIQTNLVFITIIKLYIAKLNKEEQLFL